MYGFDSPLRHIYPLEIISTHPIDEDDEIWTLEWDSIAASCLTDGLKFLLRLSPISETRWRSIEMQNRTM